MLTFSPHSPTRSVLGSSSRQTDQIIGRPEGLFGRCMQWPGACLWMALRYKPDPWAPTSFMPPNTTPNRRLRRSGDNALRMMCDACPAGSSICRLISEHGVTWPLSCGNPGLHVCTFVEEHAMTDNSGECPQSGVNPPTEHLEADSTHAARAARRDQLGVVVQDTLQDTAS
jgi:hypothetical protein